MLRFTPPRLRAMIICIDCGPSRRNSVVMRFSALCCLLLLITVVGIVVTVIYVIAPTHATVGISSSTS